MNITVVGGGFGGVKAALELSKDKDAQITLISDRPDFQYYPALYGTATGKSHLQSWVPLGEIFAGRHNVNIIVDKIVRLNKESKSLAGESGLDYSYQKLVLALGSVTTYFGIPGLQEYAFGIKSHDEIVRLKQHLLDQFMAPHSVDKDFLIIGAGPTGVELGAALGSYVKHLKKHYRQPGADTSISIIEAAPRVLPRMSEGASKKIEKRLKKLGVKVETNKKVESETANSLLVSGRSIKSHTVIWTSGVANNPFFTDNADNFEFSKNGRIVVDSHMRIDPNIYVIGDNAFTPFGGLAQTALHDGIYVARQILGKSKKKYKVKQPPVVVPVGEWWAMFEYKKIHFGGLMGALVRSAADFFGYHDMLPFGQALGVWRASRIREEAVYYSHLSPRAKRKAVKKAKKSSRKSN